MAGDDKRARMCTSKVRYGSEDIALSAVISLSRKHGPGRVYRCPYCGQWHVTTHDRTGRRLK